MKDLKPEDIKKLLLKREQEVQETLDSLQESAKPVDLNDPIGRLSRMDAMQQQQMLLSSKKRCEVALEQIKAALERVEGSSYGYCLKCDEEIADKRLHAKPEAPFCTKCQD